MRNIPLLAIVLAILISPACKKEREIVDPVTPVVLRQGPFLSGSVVDSEGNPISGVAVTDGFVWSETDKDGNYCFESPYPERVHFVSARIPASYSPVLIDGRPVFWSAVTNWQGQERKANIVLKKRSGAGDSFNLLMMADPQTLDYNAQSTLENLSYASRDVCEDVFADMRDYLAGVDGPNYGICLGDISGNIRNHSGVYSQYCLGMASLGIPFFQVIGNHDQLHSDVETDDESAAPFEAIFGPRNYSFDLGQIHFVVIDNCIYKKGSFTYPFIYGFEDAFLSWLKDDLSRVAKDTPVMICTHANILSEKEGVRTGEKYYNNVEFLEAIQGFDKMYVWTGHWHLGSFVGVVNHPSNVSRVEAFTLARVSGQSGGNWEYCSDGTPRGYVVLNVSGKEISWNFKPIKDSKAPWRGIGPAPVYKWHTLSENAQMHVYPRGSYDDDFVYANVFLWDKHWGLPVLNVGGRSFSMTRDCCYDLAYKESVTFCRESRGDPSIVGDYWGDGKLHTFRVRVPDGVSGMGSVSVKDRFGKTWTQEVSVDPAGYDDGLRHLTFDFREAPSGCPSSSASNVSFTVKGYTMLLSKGYHKTAEEGYLVIDGAGSFLSLPTLAGYKLVGITVHVSDNTMSSLKAHITDTSGGVPAGGTSIEFWGECADTWLTRDALVDTVYRIVSETSAFHICEMRLAYRKMDGFDFSGTDGNYVVDRDDIVFK